MDLTLVTCLDIPEPDFDEQPLVAALAAAGVEARVAAWDDPAVDWGATPLTVVRSAWNYAQDRTGFLNWMRSAASQSTVLRNPLAVMMPNTHKGYLAGLDRADVPVVPTKWFARNPDATDVSDIEALQALPWDSVIVKPAVGGGSSGVRAFDLAQEEEVEAAAAHVAELRRSGDAMVQPRLQSIVRTGEQNIVWIDGEITHVITKRERLAGGHERVGDEEGIEVAREPTDAERQLAGRVLRTIPQVAEREVLYARIDIAPDELGTLRVVELELVEPSLFLIHHQPAMDRFVAALARECGRTHPVASDR